MIPRKSATQTHITDFDFVFAGAAFGCSDDNRRKPAATGVEQSGASLQRPADLRFKPARLGVRGLVEAMKMKSLSFVALGVAAASVALAEPQPLRVAPTSAQQMQLSFASVVKKTAPAVVNVYTKRQVRNPFADDPFFRRFFGVPRGGQGRVQTALGSGVVVRSDGVIVTNNHVVAGADEIAVVMADRREFEAKVVLADERTDLAVLRVNARGLPALRFHDSDDAEVGDIVLAIGNPFGLGQTVTSGIISALARTRAGISDYQFFIQTDAAINRGNSGGALVTVGGELIGINSAIYSSTGGSIGIGFAIPSNMVKTVVDTALGGAKTVARPWLGVDVQVVDRGIAESMGLDRPVGVVVTSLAPASPAAQAGLQNGDVITKIDDFEINDEPGLNFRVATKGIGNTANLTYIRGGQTRTASVRLVKEPEGVPRSSVEIGGRNPLQGAQVSNLTPALAEELGVEKGSGVLITDLSRGSPAAIYGFAPGDLIVTVNGRRVSSVTQLEQALKGANGWRITAVGPNGTKTISVR
jgi:serine protease Do